MIDLVYVVGSGSRWKNNEIRYSLRSVEKNMEGVGNIYVVGAEIPFLQNVISIHYPDIFRPTNSAGNVAEKLIRVCKESSLSEDFLFMNDDFIVLKKIMAENVPFLFRGDMMDYYPEYWNGGEWRNRKKRTMELMNSLGMETLDYDLHCPIIFNKQLFPEIINRFDWRSGGGLLYRSLYFNTLKVSGEQLTNQKRTFFKSYNLKQIEERTAKPTFMAFSDAGLNGSMKWFLQTNFPGMSRYEKTDIEYPVTAIKDWFNNGRDYFEGVKLFRENSVNFNIPQRAQYFETPSRRKLLEDELNKILRKI